MKGMVFTEFIEMVECRFSADMVDDIIEDAVLPNGGAYTAVGTYDHREMVRLVSALSRRTGMTADNLLRVFGSHLFGRFHAGYPEFFAKISDAFVFLSGIEDIIHAEVRKLYPDAQLPRFITEEHTSERLVLVYQSERHFEALAEGLIQGCIAHYGGGISLGRETLAGEAGRMERFTLVRHGQGA